MYMVRGLSECLFILRRSLSSLISAHVCLTLVDYQPAQAVCWLDLDDFPSSWLEIKSDGLSYKLEWFPGC